jgi:hypothetical protein
MSMKEGIDLNSEFHRRKEEKERQKDGDLEKLNLRVGKKEKLN